MNYPEPPAGLSPAATKRRQVIIGKVNSFFDDAGEEKDQCLEDGQGDVNYLTITAKSGRVCKVGYTTE